MDIDIDFQTTFEPTQIIKQAIAASQVSGGKLSKHPCGYYFQTMPVDPYSGLAAIPHNQADQFGFFKIDFLHLSVLNHFSSKEEIRALIRKEPNWDLLQDPNEVAKLFQISKHHEMLQELKPRSVLELSDCIALIRPGKRYLLRRYKANKQATRKELYEPREGAYCYKKPHAISYALTIVLQLHLIAQGKL